MKPRGTGLFVTGTDTGVGKTEIACGLLRAYARRGLSVVGMKPVSAGAERRLGVLRNADVEALRTASTLRVAAALCNPYAFVPAIAPHIAAGEARTSIRLQTIARAYRQLAGCADVVIVEGVGGFRVPLTARHDTGDLAQRLGLPVILIVGMRLGCLSHALLTAEAIARCGLELRGWVANRIDVRMQRYEENLDALRTRLRAPLIGVIPHRARVAQRRLAVDRHLAIDAVSPLLDARSRVANDSSWR